MLHMLCAHAATVAWQELWPQNSQLTVWLIDPTPLQHSLVVTATNEWEKHINLRFVVTQNRPAASHIRIAFHSFDGSFLGRHSQLHDTQPTMLLGSLGSAQVSLAQKRRIVMHELGHAIGLEHEFRHPDWPFGYRWRAQQVARCEQLLTLDESTNCEQLMQPLPRKARHYTPFDAHSIMSYPISAKWLDDHNTDLIPSNTLTAIDKMVAAFAYPRTSATTAPESLAVAFVNYCQQAVKIEWFDTHKPRNGAQSLTLLAGAKSEWLTLDAPQLKIKAETISGDFRWHSYDSSQFLTFINQDWLQQGYEIPFYCN